MADLKKKIAFLNEIDKLKSVVRASPLADSSRRENSAEHSWHLAMYAMILSEYSTRKIDIYKVIVMLLLHDIVEIDAGDAPIHGSVGIDDQEEKELAAAQRIFGLLPTEQGEELRAIWLEFESAETDDARFAKSLDRLQPLLQNISTGGGTWAENNLRHEQVLDRYGPTIEAGSVELWQCAKSLVDSHFS